MISIVISEKGGSERHEHYDQDEVTIGRVKGNDVLLPKGNVSKRHARLIVRDGRYIVTDLKSTNGTYVNHRRITHATLVREGDRIYIGDFVLRIEDPLKSSVPASPASRDSSTSQSAYSRIPAGTPSVGSPPLDATHMPDARDDVVSHFPIEHDPDESSPLLDVPGPPRVPTGFRGSSPSGGLDFPPNHVSPNHVSPNHVSPNHLSSSHVSPNLLSPNQPSSGRTSNHLTPNQDARGSSPGSLAISSEPHTPSLPRSSPPATEDRSAGAKRELLEKLVGWVEEELGDALDVPSPDSALRARVETALGAAVARAKSEAQGEDVEPEAVREQALAELLELGPLGPLLDDEHITQVQVVLRDVIAHRRGRRLDGEGRAFGSERGVRRALSRICSRAGAEIDPDQPYVELELDGGRQLFAVRPSVSPEGHLITIRQPATRRATLDMMVRSGAISRGMATLLSHCVAARANILVAGAAESGTWELVSALADAAPRHARPLWLRDRKQLDHVPAGSAAIDLDGDAPARLGALRAATKLASDHLLVPPLAGEELATLLYAVTQGTDGVALCAVAGTLRQAIDRLSADLAATRGLGMDTARDWLGASFDLGLEVTRLRDGRLRVVRLAELRSGSHGTSVRDVFTFSYHRTAAGGSIEGAFYASGTVPRIVEDLAARGLPLDTAIFRRHPSS